MGLYISGGNKVGGMYMADGNGGNKKIGGMYYADGKGNATKIYSSFLPVGTVLWSGNSGSAKSYTVELSQPITKCKTGLAFSFNTRAQTKSLRGSGYGFTGNFHLTVSTNKISKTKLTIGSTATLGIKRSVDYNDLDTSPYSYGGPYGPFDGSPQVKVQVVSETTLKLYLGWSWKGTVDIYAPDQGGLLYTYDLSAGGVLPVTKITSY